ncbi:hypothetical protein Vretifemale_17435, partial [Volvox reticuliferus]
SIEQMISAILQPASEPPQQPEHQQQTQHFSWSLPAPGLCPSLEFATSQVEVAGTGEDQQHVANSLSIVEDSSLVHSSPTMPEMGTGSGSQSMQGLMMTVEVTAGDEDPDSATLPDNVSA